MEKRIITLDSGIWVIITNQEMPLLVKRKITSMKWSGRCQHIYFYEPEREKEDHIESLVSYDYRDDSWGIDTRGERISFIETFHKIQVYFLSEIEAINAFEDYKQEHIKSLEEKITSLHKLIEDIKKLPVNG